MPTERGLGLPNPQSYRFLSDELLLDEVTGLYWERLLGQRPFQTWEGALATCEDLQLEGFNDWRLPSRIELTSILSLDQLDPAIDWVAFPGTLGDWFWTSTPDAADEQRAWYVYFYLGYPNRDGKDNRFSVRCVRSEKAGPAPVERYQLSTDTVVDVLTGLEWQRRVPSEQFSFVEATAYCSDLELHGARPWRAPTMQELQTVVDARYHAPAIDPIAFPGTPSASFWSLTPWVESPLLRGWHVDFKDGSALYLLGTTPFHVRCVR
jgi:Protein of unknown function (DUF1566)